MSSHEEHVPHHGVTGVGRVAGQITFLPTADLAATDAFYTGLVGLPLVRDQGVCRIYGTAPGAYLLHVRLASSHGFAFVDAPLVTMHLHHAPRISTSVSAKLKGHRRFFDKHRQQIESDRVVLHARLKEIGRYLLAAGELHEARQVLGRAWRLEVRDRVVVKRLLLTFSMVRALRDVVRNGSEAEHRGAPAQIDDTRSLHG